MAEVGVLQLTIEDDSESAAKGLEHLADVLERVRNAVGSGLNLEETARQMKVFADAVSNSLDKNVIQKLEQFSNALAGMKSTVSNAVSGIAQGAQSGVGNVQNAVADALEGTEQTVARVAEATQESMTTVSGAMEDAAGSTGTVTDGMVEVEASVEAATGSAHRFADALDFIKTKAKGAWSALTETRDGVNGLKGAFSAMFPTLSTFLSGMGRIAKYRLIRTIIKQITSGMSEGIQNVYHYSKAIGSSFAPAMDSAATALLQMKNSIGAALAPMIQSLIPYLQIVINWFINLINYVNQFVSLLRGQQTWTRAVPKTTQAFEGQTKAAKKAGGAIKDLLADWDELNIIQSESGGGGGGAGTSAAEDYLNMFEEVGKYEGWIKNLVDGINDQFGDVWGLVKRIGLAILGWKLSSVFTGWLGLLGGLGLIDLEFNISAMLNKKYLDTGEVGWLIADVLKALVGGVLMKKLLSHVLAGEYAYLGIPIMLTVNASARIVTLLGNADVSALSEEGLISNVVSALELGGVAGYLSYTSGASFGQAIGGGVAAVLLTFGALTNLKADVDAIRNGEVTEDTIKAKALGSIVMGIGSSVAAKLLVPGVSTAQAAGFGLATGAAAFLLTLGATVGITATTKAVESGITTDVLLEDVASSLSMGLGGAIIIKMAGLAETWSMSAAAGAGVALVTAGALIGIQATIEAVQNDGITVDTIIKDATSSLLMGGGVALIAGTLCGLGAGAALTVGGLAALTTFGALIGIQAILSLIDREDKVKWGDEILTEKEVQDYVNTQVFDVKLPVAISLVKSKMEDVEVAEKELEGKVGDVLPVINTLLLGFDTKGSLIELDKEIFGKDGLIKKYNSTISSKKAEIEAALVLVPIKDKGGNDMSAEYLKGISEGWSNIDNIMSNLGKSLTDTMYDSYSGQLKTNLSKMERETIADLTQTMLEIATIMSSSETEVNMKRNFAKGLGSLSGGSIDDIVKFYQSQKEIDIQAMKDTYDIYLTDLDEQKLTNEKLLEKALKNGGEYAGKSVEYYRGEIQRIQGLYNQVVAMQDDSVKAAMKFYTNGEGLAQVRKAIMGAIVGSIENTDISSGLVNVGKEGEMGWTALFDMKGNYVDGAKDAVKEWMNEIIRQAFPKDAKYILDAIDAGIIGYGDLFNDEVVKELTRQLGFNEPDVTDDFREKWNSLLADIFGDASETPQYENTVNLDTTVEESVGYKLVQDSVPSKEEAAKMMTDLFPQSNVDLLHRKVLQYGDDIATLLTETITASEDGSEGLQWNEDLVMNLTPITPDGKKLTDNEFHKYVESLLGKSGSLEELFKNDRIENGGLGLLLSADTGFSSFDEAIAKAEELAASLSALQGEYYKDDPIVVPPVDYSLFGQSLGTMLAETITTVDNIKQYINSLNGQTLTISTRIDPFDRGGDGGRRGGGGIDRFGNLRVQGFRAMGGPIRSGDLIMANENGNIEMMGQMGTRPVVANNQQIVAGITAGVAQANSGMESRLNTIESLLNRILQKEFVAKAVPGASWGQHNTKSNVAYEKMTGVQV